jgi:magnesium transporter
MITVYLPREQSIERTELPAGEPVPPEAVWIDLLSPTPEEKARVNEALGIELPTREEQMEIEPSSRLYQEGDTVYMTATVFTQADTPNPSSDVITFVLNRKQLVTLRSVDPRPITQFGSKLQRQPALCSTGDDALIGLVEAFVDRIADILEKLSIELDALSRQIFGDTSEKPRRDLQGILRALGRTDDLASTARESLHSLARLLSFLTQALQTVARKEMKQRLKTVGRDIASLGEHAAFEARKVSFLLDATLGMINVEQNGIIKIFSVAAVVFLPPTLVASIYGMNFSFMPELQWLLGYPMAIGLMVLSAVLPYLWFKRKGWL